MEWSSSPYRLFLCIRFIHIHWPPYPWYSLMTKEAELTNGRLAMIGFNILIINYVMTGNIIPGIL